MKDFGQDIAMDLGVVESFSGLQVIPRDKQEDYGVRPFNFGADSNSSSAKNAGSQDAQAEPEVSAEELAYQKGYNAAKSEFAAAQADLASRMEDTLAQLNKAFEASEQGHDQQTLQLALMVAEKLACRALEQDPGSLIARALETLSHERSDLALSVVADPATAGVLRNQMANLRSSLQVSAIEVEEDNRLAPGDMRLSRGAITLDARMATRLVRIKRALERELGLEIGDVEL